MKITLFGALAASGIATGVGLCTLAVAMVSLAGCSSQDPVTRTPYYHVGTPTNRSSVNSYDPNNEPFYTQPGVNSGVQVPPPAKRPSERGYEPYDPLAESAYAAIGKAGVHTKYISATAKGSTVVLTGSVDNSVDMAKAVNAAGKVHGVKLVRNELTIAQTAVAAK